LLQLADSVQLQTSQRTFQAHTLDASQRLFLSRHKKRCMCSWAETVTERAAASMAVVEARVKAVVETRAFRRFITLALTVMAAAARVTFVKVALDCDIAFWLQAVVEAKAVSILSRRLIMERAAGEAAPSAVRERGASAAVVIMGDALEPPTMNKLGVAMVAAAVRRQTAEAADFTAAVTTTASLEKVVHEVKAARVPIVHRVPVSATRVDSAAAGAVVTMVVAAAVEAATQTVTLLAAVAAAVAAHRMSSGKRSNQKFIIDGKRRMGSSFLVGSNSITRCR
jgi:hypothetical protein